MKRTLAALMAALALAGCTADLETPAARCDPDLDQAFTAWADAGFSGSIAISTAGEFECLGAYGLADQASRAPNTVDTVFAIGSVSKAFTAAAVLKLVDDGRLSLDDRAGERLPGLGGPVASATVEHLLLHTSGLTGWHGHDHEPLGREAAVAAIGELELAFEPGADFLYSNAGYTLLALIVEETSGMPYRDYMVSEILPLPGGDAAGGFWDGEPAAPGPRAIGYHDSGPTDQMGDFAGPHWALDGNGDLAMTTRDLARWTHALFAGQVVSPRSVDVIASPGVDMGDGASETPGWVRYDESRYGEPFLATAGGGGETGHNVAVAWVPGSERAIAVASNTPDVTAEDLLQAVGPSLLAGEPLPVPESSSDDIDPADLADTAGTYRLQTGGSFTVTARAGGLAISATGTDAVAALFPLPSGVTDDDVAAHEDGVLALLSGESQQGRKERATLESDFGAIERVDLAGTIVQDGELRTYVTVRMGAEPVTLWYALDQRGGIAAVEGPAPLPTLLLVSAGGDRYRPDDPTGSGPHVTVAFDGDRMTITGRAGTTNATRL